MNASTVNHKTTRRQAGLLALALAPLFAEADCGSAMCLLDTDWSTQGVWTEPGMRFDLRYEAVRQDHLRAGTRQVEAAGLLFGMKLATGRDDVIDPNGERAEPGLQPQFYAFFTSGRCTSA